MRRLPFRVRAALLALLWVASCHAEPAPPLSTATPAPITPAPAAAEPGGHNLAMGTGEPRIPEPFTVEQRLLDAVRRNDRATIERALQRGAPIDAKDDIGRNAVLLAVLDANDLDLARWLHDKGAAVDEPDSGGRSALSFAAENGRADMVAWLIAQGAAVDRRDVQQRSPLEHAALGDHADVIALLLDRGADINGRDQFGDTPLIVACAKGNANAAAMLLQRG
ncbi:MAG: ankyrin repeat domain-containing protein, partial [bacterium]